MDLNWQKVKEDFRSRSKKQPGINLYEIKILDKLSGSIFFLCSLNQRNEVVLKLDKAKNVVYSCLLINVIN